MQEDDHRPSNILNARSVHQAEAGSAVQRYRAVTVGHKGWGYLLRYEILTLGLSNLPGALGLWVRQTFYRSLFGKFGRSVAIGRGVSFRQPSQVSLGDRVIVEDYARIMVLGSEEASSISLGDCVFVGPYSVCSSRNARICIGDHASVSSHCRIGLNGGRLEIGQHTMIAAFCYIGGTQHATQDLARPMMLQDCVSKGDLIIEEDVWIGAHSFLMPGIRVGHGAVIGACSMVNKDVPPYAIVYGVPARVQGFREGAPKADAEAERGSEGASSGP